MYPRIQDIQKGQNSESPSLVWQEFKMYVYVLKLLNRIQHFLPVMGESGGSVLQGSWVSTLSPYLVALFGRL